MSRPFIASDSEETEGSASFEDDSSMQDDDSVSDDLSSGSGSNSEEEPELRDAARAEKEKKRKNTDDDSTREKKRAKVAAEEKEDEADSVKSGAVTVADTQGRSRVPIPNPATTVLKLVHLSAPAYTSFAPTATGWDPGGQSVVCVLGPAAWRSVNSDAKSAASLPCLAPIRISHPGRGFIAGHLLNAQFGGPNSLENMTALTSSANGQQKSFDNHIVNACGLLHKVYLELNNVGIDVMVLGYGIQLNIDMHPNRWPGAAPNDCISIRMTCTALVVSEPDIDTLMATVYPGGKGLPDLWISTRKTILTLVQGVQDEVATANLASTVTNT